MSSDAGGSLSLLCSFQFSLRGILAGSKGEQRAGPGSLL